MPQALKPASARRFVETPTTRLIRDEVKRAVATAEPIAILGPAGVGKTTVLTAIADEDHRAKFDTITPMTNSMTNAIATVAHALGAHTYKRHSHELFDIVCSHLPFVVDHGGYLIVDEVQSLPANVLRQILAFNDLFGLPLVLAGNEHALKRTRANAAAFDQIDSRIRRIRLAGISEADIHAFCTEYDVEGIEAYRLAARFGTARNLRETVKMLEEARRFAGNSGPIRKAAILDAIAYLYGPQEAGTLKQREA